MPRFFVSEKPCDSFFILTGESAHHIARSLRMATGEHIVVCDGQGTDYDCVLSRITDTEVQADVQSCQKSLSEFPFPVTLYQGLPKSDKMETIIQKAVECGVTRIVPFESSRCIVRITDKEEKKLERFRKIALEAAKQSGRGIVPEIALPVTYKQALRVAEGCKFICYEDEHHTMLSEFLTENKKPSAVSFFVGPEGGFSPEEVELAKENGLTAVSLGHRILRTETAPLFVLSCLSYHYENKEEEG